VQCFEAFCPNATIHEQVASDSPLSLTAILLLDEDNIENLLDNPDRLLEDFQAVQRHYWMNIFPDVSRCAPLLDAAILTGRGLDEVLIVMSLTLAGEETSSHEDVLADTTSSKT
jgi:hypothetical protein